MRSVIALGFAGLAMLATGGLPSLSAQGRPETPRYRVTDLGVLPGRDRTEASALNDHGVIVGAAYDYYGGRSGIALVWDHGKFVRLPAPPGYRATAATAINKSGQITGGLEKTYQGMNYVSACLWTDRKPRVLPTLRGHFGTATDVSNSGVVVGWSAAGTQDFPRSWCWRESTLTWLPTPPGRPISRDCHVNDFGQIAGAAERATPEADGRAVLWEQGRVTELPGAYPGFDAVFQINHLGQCVGRVHRADGNEHAALWEKKGEVRDLGTLGGLGSTARGMNDRGQVVGESDTNAEIKPGGNLLDPDPRAFLWEQGKMTDLNTLLPHRSGWVLREATAINNRGQIIGHGQFKGELRPVLLTPILPSR